MKKTLLLSLSVISLLLACNGFKETPEVGTVLAAHFNNKLYKKFDTAVYNVVFRKHLDSLKKDFSNPKTLGSFYRSKGDQPVLVTRHFASGGLDTLYSYLQSSGQHGVNSKIFASGKIESLLGVLRANTFKSIEEVYPVVADLELYAAEALDKYTGYIQYGGLNPKKILNRYYIEVRRPDTLSIFKTLDTEDLVKSLKDMQPSSDQYLALQRMLAKYKLDSTGRKKEIKAILVNMERLRWKLPELGKEYIEVNIPDFTLTWHAGKDTLSHMKVCVGGRREKAYEEKMKVYAKTGNLSDLPKNHQTPLIYSTMKSIQANPIWNIPVSIARSEIYYMAMKDPYYLSNNNIQVYYKGKLVGDPDTIQWSRYPREKLPFQFKQGSGVMNALGKFKFIFDNSSSIYLHDTNNKNGFRMANRAISHGCIRLERPLEFAEKLVDNKNMYDQLRMEVGLAPLDTNNNRIYRKKLARKADTLNVFKLKPAWFAAKKPVPLLINYKTAWWQNGGMQYREDIYDLDESLWIAMKKFL